MDRALPDNQLEPDPARSRVWRLAVYQCGLCAYLYDEDKEGTAWADLPDDWVCPVCGSPKSAFTRLEEKKAPPKPPADAKPRAPAEYLGEWRRASDEVEVHMALIDASGCAREDGTYRWWFRCAHRRVESLP